MLWAVLIFIVCYLIGSIPFAVIVSRLVMGIDLRQHGSGNMGATNAARVLGKKWFPVVFGLDFTKGLVATYLAFRFVPGVANIDPVVATAIGGLAVVAGHCFPIFAGFKGGVGLAATGGALVILSPWMMVASGLSILLFWRLARDQYIGVCATAILYPVFAWFFLGNVNVVFVGAIWGAMVFALHLKDINNWLTARRAQ